MCRSIPLGKAAAGLPDLWLEVRPVRAVAAQPKIDASAVTLTVGVQAETRITPAESKPDCPFPATVEIVPPMDQGRVSLGVPIDLPFTEVNKLIEAQLKGRVFPEDKSGPVEVTINRATLAASGDRLLISLRVKASEKKSWFSFGADATVHVWGKPVLDAAQQTLRLSEIAIDVESEAAYGLLGTAARAAIPYVMDALAENAKIDLKPFATTALKNIQAAIAEFRSPQPGVQVDAAVTALAARRHRVRRQDPAGDRRGRRHREGRGERAAAVCPARPCVPAKAAVPPRQRGRIRASRRRSVRSSVLPVPMQRIAVGVEPALGAFPVRADARDHAPERARVVHLDQMRHLMRRQIVEHVRRREDQPPRIGEHAGRGA